MFLLFAKQEQEKNKKEERFRKLKKGEMWEKGKEKVKKEKKGGGVWEREEEVGRDVEGERERERGAKRKGD